MAGTLGGVCGPGSSDLLATLADGLDKRERDETLQIITRRLNAERAAAAGGQRDRQVDVGTRSRASRGRRATDTPESAAPESAAPESVASESAAPGRAASVAAARGTHSRADEPD